MAVHVEIHHRLVLLVKGEQIEGGIRTRSYKTENLWQAENDGSGGSQPLPHCYSTQRALLVMLLITCHTLASLGVNLYGCRLRSKEQEVRNGLQSLAFPSYRSGVPTHGTEIILGSGRIEAEDSSVGTVNERG